MRKWWTFYIEEDRRYTVKEAFKFLGSIICKQIGERKSTSLCDVGCATGDFLWYAVNALGFDPELLCGMDVSDKLLQVERSRLPGTRFQQVDIANVSEGRTFDCVTFLGVVSHFRDFRKIFSNLLDWVRPGGFCWIFSGFNPFDYSVKMEYTYTGDGEHVTTVEYTHSVREVSEYLKSIGKEYRWYPFEIGIDLPMHEWDFHLRAWTEQLASGKRMIRDAAERIQDQYILEIKC